jgi:hypothetical protein
VFALSLLTFTGCEEITHQGAYSYGINEYREEGDGLSLPIIQAYLNEVSCFTGNMTFESETEDANDQSAIRYFNGNAEKISKEELAKRLAGRNVEFSYAVSNSSGTLASSKFSFGSYVK